MPDETGRPALLLEGSLNLRQLLEITPHPGYLSGRSLLLLDHTGRVVAGNGILRHPVLTDLSQNPLVIAGREAERPTYTLDLPRPRMPASASSSPTPSSPTWAGTSTSPSRSGPPSASSPPSTSPPWPPRPSPSASRCCSRAAPPRR
ncbi:hypothetical protein [Oleiharenicola sp. Vm1]|uniref:hypothetical protein n=1 Tax=Oleiharenicola sp. Vm1 TaxID=3398393 RepID=UPI0039F4A0DA